MYKYPLNFHINAFIRLSSFKGDNNFAKMNFKVFVALVAVLFAYCNALAVPRVLSGARNTCGGDCITHLECSAGAGFNDNCRCGFVHPNFVCFLLTDDGDAAEMKGVI